MININFDEVFLRGSTNFTVGTDAFSVIKLRRGYKIAMAHLNYPRFCLIITGIKPTSFTYRLVNIEEFAEANEAMELSAMLAMSCDDAPSLKEYTMLGTATSVYDTLGDVISDQYVLSLYEEVLNTVKMYISSSFRST